MQKAAKAEARIKEICGKLGITEGGRNWLDVALDPFKDIPQKPIGFPDTVMTNSTVQVVHETFDISGNALGFASNWDCNLFFDHMWESKNLVTAGTENIANMFFKGNQGASLFRRGGFIVRAALSGVPLDISTTQNAMCQDLVTDVFENETSSRVLALGFEVHNTTAELSKQGSVICWRVSDEPIEYPIVTGNVQGTANNSSMYKAIELAEPPYLAGQALDLPCSVQWEAAKGVYVVPPMISENNEPQDYDLVVPICNDAATATKYMPTITLSGTLSGFGRTHQSNATYPFALAGSYFTGLSPETTLTINLTYYIEQFPAYKSPMHRLASPSCPFDPAALELYTKVVRHMPTGVEVNDNFLGAFITGIGQVMNTVARYAPTVLRVGGTVLSAAQQLSEAMGSGPNYDGTQGNRQVVNVNPRTQEREIERDIVVRRPDGRVKEEIHERAIVPYRGNERVHVNQNGGGRRNRSNPGIVVKNRRNRDYNRLDKYIKAGDKRVGNKWVN